MNSEFRAATLELLRRDLTRYRMKEDAPANWPLRRKALLHFMNTYNLVASGKNPFSRRTRELGLDWPAEALTMVGWRRLENLQECVETVLAEHVEGDLVECGVWRGGASILMKAVLESYGDTDRLLWLADSFEGLPKPDVANYKADKGVRLDWFKSILGVSDDEVRANFARYGLLDDRVRFLKGWFKDTLSDSPIGDIAVLRLDGDLYESTIQALEALYPRLVPNGFCIIDDYFIPACRKAVTDYRDEHGISADLVVIDGCAVLWRKQAVSATTP